MPSFCLSSGLPLREIPIYERKPANNSTLRMHFREALTAMLCPSHGKPGLRCTPWLRRKEKTRYPAWKSEEPPNSIPDGRATAAPLAWRLDWATIISYCFSEASHVDLLKVESPPTPPHADRD